MSDEAKPGALLLALSSKDGDKGDERPAKPGSDSGDDTRDAMASAARSMMNAAKRGDVDVFMDALDAFLEARGK